MANEEDYEEPESYESELDKAEDHLAMVASWELQQDSMPLSVEEQRIVERGYCPECYETYKPVKHKKPTSRPRRTLHSPALVNGVCPYCGWKKPKPTQESTQAG
jgi:hypothetical protein